MLKRFTKMITNSTPGGFKKDCLFRRKDFVQNRKLYVAPKVINVS